MKWELKWESVHPYYRNELYFRGEQAKLAYGSDNKRLLGISRNNVMQCYYDQADVLRLSKNAIRLLSNRSAIAKYFLRTRENTNGLIKIVRNDFSCLKTEELKRLYETIVKMYQRIFASYDISRPERFVDVERLLRINMSSEDFDIATLPRRITLIDYEHQGLLKIIIAQKPSLLLKHQRKYGWIGTSEESKVWSIKYFQKKYNSYTIKGATDELENLLQQRKWLSKEQTIIYKKYDLETVYFSKLVGQFSHFRIQTRLDWVYVGYLLQLNLKRIAKRFNITYDEILYYGEQEMRKLFDGKKIANQILENRKEAYAFLYDGEIFRQVEGEINVTTLEKQNDIIVVYKIQEKLVGSIANKGKAIGRVRVINAHTRKQSEAIESMHEGEILVTGMTRPHLIAAIRKAAAIVTDEGGITSHASIISRELGIPCITGTKIATQVLKDGDEVEVDANKGIVKVLRRA